MSALRNKAFDYLARREHSAFELRQKLQSLASSNEIDLLLQKLADNNLQSDERFTECYIRSRSQAGVGPLRIEQELLQRGVSEALISQYLSKYDEDWVEILEQVWQKKFSKNPIDNKSYAQQFRFLVQRGFSYGSVAKLLRS